MFWSIKNSPEVLDKLKCKGFRASSLSTYDFLTLYTTFPHNVIKKETLILLKLLFTGKVLFTMLVMIKLLSLFQMTKTVQTLVLPKGLWRFNISFR